MLRQTLRSFESLMTMTHPLPGSWGNSVAWLFSSSVTVQIINPTSGCEKTLWIKRGEGRAFQNRELACNPALNLTIAHTATTKKYQNSFGSSRNLCVLFGRLCTPGSAPNQTVSPFVPEQIMSKLKAHETYSFLALTVVISLFVFNSVEWCSVYFETFRAS